MEHYVTLFDSLFLPQGLALHSSLERHAGAYTLWVLCMDEEAKTILDKLNKPNIRTIAIADVETPELLSVKNGRTTGEYCWTLTPFTPKIVFERDESVQRLTYLDADVFFLKDVTPIFTEFQASGKAVLLTEHGYSPERDQTAISGRFCVQFMTFGRGASEVVRLWWQERCLEWCFNRVEDGKFGDQKYLDDWQERFPDLVHVLEQQEWTLAPWNATKFAYSSAKIYHFQSLRIGYNKEIILCMGYSIPQPLMDNVYSLYLICLQNSIDELIRSGWVLRPQTKKISMKSRFYLLLYKTIRKRFEGKLNEVSQTYISSLENR
jgi:hypothetical protein